MVIKKNKVKLYGLHMSYTTEKDRIVIDCHNNNNNHNTDDNCNDNCPGFCIVEM